MFYQSSPDHVLSHAGINPYFTALGMYMAVRVWSEWAEERNALIQIIGDSDTIPQVNPENFNITEKD